MQIEVKARDVIISDMRDFHALRRYLKEEVQSIIRPVKAMWEKQSKVVTIDTVKLALQVNGVPPEWEVPWNRMTREFVRDDVIPVWVKSIAVAGDRIARKVNMLQRKQFDFDSTMTSVKAWVDSEGGKLIVDLIDAQMASTHALLQHQIALEVTSPYILAQRIRPIVGLTQRETLAVTKFMATLTEEGVAANVINSQVANYAKFLHKNRAMRIARTEISNAYNFGQLDSMKQAAAEGWLPGVPEKSWMAGSNSCELCADNEGAGWIGLDDVFSSGDTRPTVHPSCACAVSYRVRR